MFEGNKPILIMLGTLVIVMIFGGYTFLKNYDSMTNEELQRMIELDVLAYAVDEGVQLKIDWDWTVMPTDGLAGDDYIGIAVIDKETNETRTDMSFKDASLQLEHGEKTIMEIEGEVVENGLIFAYPNKLDEQTSYGNNGHIQVTIAGEQLEEEDIRVQMLHTWEEHNGLEQQDPLFTNPIFNEGESIPHWVISR